MEFKREEKVQKAVDDKPTMTNRILPKRDFEKVIEHDKIYLANLKEILEFALVKQDVLGNKAQEILSNQTKESLSQLFNISTLLEWSQCKLLCLDTKAKIVIQEKLLTDKDTHYNKVFLPQWKKEIAESEKNFDEMFAKAEKLQKTKPKGSEDVLAKINDEMYWFDQLDDEAKTNVEYKWQLYKPLKRLITAFEKVIEKK